MLIVSPAIVTSLLAAHLGAVWIALLCLGCLGTVAIAARLRVTLTAEQDLAQAEGSDATAPENARGLLRKRENRAGVP